jgi:hypothetical protein
MNIMPHLDAGSALDPSDWQSPRAQGYHMLDDILDYIEHIRERPVWQPNKLSIAPVQNILQVA